VLAPQDAAVIDQPDRAACRVRAAAEAEEVQLIARLVSIDDVSIELADVPREAEAEHSAANAFHPQGAHAGLVLDHLRYANGLVKRPSVGVVILHESIAELHNIRRRWHMAGVPGAVAA
jgi:hypothetical protein